MEKRIELKENYVDDIGRTLYKSDDGLVYAVNKEDLFYKDEKVSTVSSLISFCLP